MRIIFLRLAIAIAIISFLVPILAWAQQEKPNQVRKYIMCSEKTMLYNKFDTNKTIYHKLIEADINPENLKGLKLRIYIENDGSLYVVEDNPDGKTACFLALGENFIIDFKKIFDKPIPGRST